VLLAARGVDTKRVSTRRSVVGPRRIQPQRTSPNSGILRPRRRTQRSLKAHSNVVHVGIADGVLVLQGFDADGYGLVAFDVGAERASPNGNIKGPCSVTGKRGRAKRRIVNTRGVGQKRVKPYRSVKVSRRVIAQGVCTQRNDTAPSRIQPQRTSPNSSIAHTRRRTQRSLKADSHVVHVDVADGVLVAEGFVAYGGRLVACLTLEKQGSGT
jgi:hypothetical protein